MGLVHRDVDKRTSDAGPRRLSRGTSGGPPSLALSASEGVRRTGLIGGRRFGSGKRRRWRAVCGKGPRCRRGASVRTGVSKRCDRKCQCPDHSACEALNTRRVGSRLKLGGGPRTRCTDGDGHSWSARLQPRDHSRSEMPSRAIRRPRGRGHSEVRTSVRVNGWRPEAAVAKA